MNGLEGNQNKCSAGRDLRAPVGTDWVLDWCGVTSEDQAITLGCYDGYGCFYTAQKAFTYKKKSAAIRFATYGQWVKHIEPHQYPGTLVDARLKEQKQKQGLHWHEGLNQWVRYGVAFHRACSQVLEQRLGYTVKFEDVWGLLAEHQDSPYYSYKPLGYMWRYNYGGTEEYHGREFDMNLLEKDAHLLLDPRLCNGNADRIVRVWEPLVQGFRSNTLDEPPSTEAAAEEAAAVAQVVGTSTAALSAAGKGPARAEVSGSTYPLLQLLVSHGATQQQQQLRVTAQLLQLCRSVPEILAGHLQLSLTAITVGRAVGVAAWLARYAGLVSALDLEVCVDCCKHDAHAAVLALAPALAAAGSSQGFKLRSFKGHVRDTEDLQVLLQHLPLQHLTSLDITGSSSLRLPAAAAAALTPATALQELSLPGCALAACMAELHFTEVASCLSVSLQRLSITKAEAMTAEQLTVLGQQLTALQDLELCYDSSSGWLIEADSDDDEGAEPAQPDRVDECWSQLPLTSLKLGTKWVPEVDATAFDPSSGHVGITNDMLSNMSGLSRLTSLTLGPSANAVVTVYDEDDMDSDVDDEEELEQWRRNFMRTLRQLKSLRQLSVTSERGLAFDEPDDHAVLLLMVAALPQLRELTLCEPVCREGDALVVLAAATHLTRLELTGHVGSSNPIRSAATSLSQQRLGLQIVYSK